MTGRPGPPRDPAPVALALDTADLDTALAWAAAAGPYLSTVKVGLELYLRHGAVAVHATRAGSGGRDVFLDLKLHDIPSTVGRAAAAVADLVPAYLTVHASGGHDMVRAAVETLPDTRVAAVTVLTSLSEDDLTRLGTSGTARDLARRLAALAVEAGARALVCSPLEVGDVRREVGSEVTIITPGVRPGGSAAGDQSRVATPEQALADGADLLVVGRPVTGADDPGQAAAALATALRDRPGR